MALRMILTAAVVSMSLPMPSTDACKSLIAGMNRELIAISAAVESEWVARATFHEITIEAPIAKQADNEKEVVESLESPTDLAFELILDEFAREAGEGTIEQARLDVSRIPAEAVRQPLPPALDASEVMPSVADLIESVKEEARVRVSDSISAEWNAVLEGRSVADTILTLDFGLIKPLVVTAVRSTEIGAWQSIIEEHVIDIAIASAENEIDTKPQPVDSLSSDWATIVSTGDLCFAVVESIDPPAQATNDRREGQVSVRDAFRKTAEAVALWSRVMARPF